MTIRIFLPCLPAEALTRMHGTGDCEAGVIPGRYGPPGERTIPAHLGGRSPDQPRVVGYNAGRLFTSKRISVRR